MEKYIRFIKKNRKTLLALLIVINVLAIWGVFKVKLNSDFQIFTPTESIYKDKIEAMNKYFPSSDQLIVQIEINSTVMDEDIYTSVYKFYDFIDNFFEGKITGLITTDFNNSSISDLKFQIDILDDLSSIKILDNKMYISYTLFSKNAMTHSELVNIEEYLKDNNFEYAISGNAYMELKVIDYIGFILTRIPPLALIIILFIFTLKIKSIKGTLLSILPAGLGALWTLGMVGWIGEPVSILTVLAPIFTIVIGSADGLHFITHVQEEQSIHGDTNLALSKTLKMVGVPMIVTTVTSIAGFLALLVMQTEAIKGLALFASLGILFAGIATWYVLPLILTGDIIIHSKNHKDKKNKMGLRVLWGWPSLVIVIIVMAIFTIGANNISQEFNMLSIYRDYTDVNKYNESISKVNGGTLPVFIYGSLPSEVSQEMNINNILNFEENLKDLDGIGKVVSGYDFISKFKNTNYLDTSLFSEFINFEENKFKIIVFTTDHENKTLQNLNDFVEDYSIKLPNYDLEVTGVGFMMMELNENMKSNQIMSSLLAIIIVFFLLLISLKHFKSALVSLVPIILTLFTLFGFLGISNISLNIITSTIFSISIGVGIDYAIHFTSIWRTRVKEGMSSREAVDSAYYYCATPVIANAFGLSLGFSALFLSPLQIHVTVATLMWVSMMTSVAFSLIILPSILQRIKT